MSHWQEKVYQHQQDNLGMTKEEWIILRDTVLTRDHFRCKRCDKRFKRSLLSAHHIMPRDEGGSSDLSNLITLCNPCHDFVEITHLKTLADIIGSFEDAKKIVKDDPTPLVEVSRPDWHTWVYGGSRNPGKVGVTTR